MIGRERRTPRPAAVLAAAVVLAGLMLAAGCKDEIAAPTMGFVAVDAAGVTGVEVLVDGESFGTSDRVGPLDAGTYTISVAKTFYEVTPSSVDVTVEAGRTVTASFALELVSSGSLAVTASDELLGDAVTGAEILVDFGAGYQASGQSTPATLTDLPPGTLRLMLRRSGFEETPAEATVEVGETTDVDVALGPPRAVLGEMFTFISCAGCPEAAAELDELRSASPDRFYVIEWHSQFPFPLYDTRWEDRQDFYTGGGDIAKPAVLFQGGTADSPRILIGSESSQLGEYHTRTDAYLAECDVACPVAVKVLGDISAAGADYDVRVRWRGGTLPTGLFLQVVLQENHVLSPGNQPWFDFVPRDLAHHDATTLPAPFVLSTPGEIVRIEGSFAVDPSWAPEELHLVAYVQSSDTGEVLAVSGL